MNEHYADIVHRDRMSQYRQEADASRQTAGRQGGLRPRIIPLGAVAAGAALLALAFAMFLGAASPI